VPARAGQFELVKQGDVRTRIEDTIVRLGALYEAGVAAVAPDAPSYADACRVVLERLPALLP